MGGTKLKNASFPPMPELSLMEGGALNRALQGALNVQRSGSRRVARIAIVFALSTWVPLLALSAMQGAAWGTTVDQPFLGDFTQHVRFLFALPLLIVADVIVGPRFAKVGKYLMTSGLVADSQVSNFQTAVRSAMRFRDSTLSELAIIVIAYVSAALYIQHQFGAGVSSWLLADVHGRHLTFAGWWYLLVSIPIFQFFLYRWLLRLFNWSRLMYRLSRLDLQLAPTHPDRAGGLVFLADAMPATGLIIVAVGAVLCSAISVQIFHRGASFEQFAYSYAGFAVIVVVAVLGPFAVFTPQLIAMKRRALMEYGALGIRLGQLFDQRWVGSGSNDGLPGSGDISSVSGFERTYALIQRIKLLPLEFADLRAIVIATALPLIPFVGTHIPVERVWKLLQKVLI